MNDVKKSTGKLFPRRWVALLCIAVTIFCGIFVAAHWMDLRLMYAEMLKNRAIKNEETKLADFQASVSEAMGGYVFTPEAECIVDRENSGGYNLATGSFIPYQSLTPWDQPMESAEWQAGSGVDVMADIHRGWSPAAFLVNTREFPDLASSNAGPGFFILSNAVISNHPVTDWKVSSPWMGLFQQVQTHTPALPAPYLPADSSFTSTTGKTPSSFQPAAFDVPPPEPEEPGLEVNGEPRTVPAVALAGGSAIEVTGMQGYANPVEFMMNFLLAHPAGGNPSSVEKIPRGASLDDLLDRSGLAAPVKGRLAILPAGDPSMSLWGGMQREFARTWLVRTLGGRVGLLQTIYVPGDEHPLKIRWQLLEKSAGAEAVAPAAPAEFRFHAWLDEERATPDWRAWAHNGELLDRKKLQLPDGVPAPPQEEIAKLDASAGAPRYVTFRFFCPGLDPLSVADVRMLNASSRPQTDPLAPANALNITEAHTDPHDKDSGWVAATLYVERADRLPPWALIQLRYSTGPWLQWHELPPDFSGRMAMDNGDIVTRAGQGEDGRAFIELMRNPAKENAVGESDYERHAKISEQLDFTARTKDGRMLTRAAITSGTDSDGIITDRYIFDVPQGQVAAFQGRKRPVWHITQNVMLLRGRPPYTDADKNSPY